MGLFDFPGKFTPGRNKTAPAVTSTAIPVKAGYVPPVAAAAVVTPTPPTGAKSTVKAPPKVTKEVPQQVDTATAGWGFPPVAASLASSPIMALMGMGAANTGFSLNRPAAVTPALGNFGGGQLSNTLEALSAGNAFSPQSAVNTPNTGVKPPMGDTGGGWFDAFTGALGGVADKIGIPDWMTSPISALKSKGAFDTVDPRTQAVVKGWLGPTIEGVKGLGELYLGKKTYDLSRDQANFQKQAYLTNYANQVQSMNRDLEDRQRNRRASSVNAESVDSYMSRNRVI